MIQARTPMIATPTTAAVYSGIGWSNGMAAQVSLPNMLVLLRRTNGGLMRPKLGSN